VLGSEGALHPKVEVLAVWDPRSALRQVPELPHDDSLLQLLGDHRYFRACCCCWQWGCCRIPGMRPNIRCGFRREIGPQQSDAYLMASHDQSAELFVSQAVSPQWLGRCWGCACVSPEAGARSRFPWRSRISADGVGEYSTRGIQKERNYQALHPCDDPASKQ